MQETVVYIKISVSEDPDETGSYDTDEGISYFIKGFNGGWFDNIDDPDTKTYRKWWLKPIPLSSLLQEGAPTDEEIEAELFNYEISTPENAFRGGAEWMRKKILGI
jgi:hypothetical protein